MTKMNNSTKDNNTGHLSDKLFKYLSGEMPEKDKGSFQKEIEQNPLLNDAVEGLKNIDNPEDVQDSLLLLKKQLKKNLQNRNKRGKRNLQPTYRFWIVIVAVLAILLVAALVGIIPYFFKSL